MTAATPDPQELRDDVEAVVDAYRDDLLAAGMFAQNPVTSPARSFLLEIGIEGWGRCR
jgi:integrase/recombinase XerD